ncbi:hypothetical protein J6590_031971 [Homalodisca vitripennis]|nr:hypothetical protein J6590_031971 [Homalodisca vitripennis]
MRIDRRSETKLSQPGDKPERKYASLMIDPSQISWTDAELHRTNSGTQSRILASCYAGRGSGETRLFIMSALPWADNARLIQEIDGMALPLGYNSTQPALGRSTGRGGVR